MFRIRDSLGSDEIWFHYAKERSDLPEVAAFIKAHTSLGIDTESTGINCYRPGWQLRTVQVGNADHSFIIPARHKKFVAWMMKQPMKWIGHNGPHDIRSIDQYLSVETGVRCAGETYIPAHYLDSRKQEDGGIGHGLKEQAIRFVGREAGKWEQALKAAFKEITIPLPGQTYKSGARKGQQKVRKAKLSEGWALIDPEHPAYLAYAAADPLLTFRLWTFYQPIVRQFHELYRFDRKVQLAADRLHRRAIRLDTRYTSRLSAAYTAKANQLKDRAAELGVENVNSGAQIARALEYLGRPLVARTLKGTLKTDNTILRELAASCPDEPVKELIHCILGAKQMEKRRESYTDQMLLEADENNRVHPSINTMGARTTRMSVSNPPLQQLPTKDREDDAE